MAALDDEMLKKLQAQPFQPQVGAAPPEMLPTPVYGAQQEVPPAAFTQDRALQEGVAELMKQYREPAPQPGVFAQTMGNIFREPGSKGLLGEAILGLTGAKGDLDKQEAFQTRQKRTGDLLEKLRNLGAFGDTGLMAKDIETAKLEREKLRSAEKIAGMKAAKETDTLAREKFDYAKDKDVETGATKISDTIQKNILPGVSALKTIDDLIPGGLDSDEEIPYFGGSKTLKTIGRKFKAATTRAGDAEGDKARATEDLVSSLDALFNQKLHERSGTAVTKTEMKKLEDEYARGEWDTPSKLRKNLRRYRDLLAENTKHEFTGARDKSKQLYISREGALTPEQIKSIGKGKSGVKQAAGGTRGLDDGGVKLSSEVEQKVKSGEWDIKKAQAVQMKLNQTAKPKDQMRGK